jgi:hypothetical protein
MKKTLFLLLTAAVMVTASCSKKEDSVPASGPVNTDLMSNSLKINSLNVALKRDPLKDTDYVHADIVPDGDYVFWNGHSRLVLDLKDQGKKDGTQLQQWSLFSTETAFGSANQVFHIHRLTGTSYEITSAFAGGRSWDVKGHGVTNGTPIQIWEFGNTANQKWILNQLSTFGVYTIQSAESGKMVDIADNSLNNGALLHLWDYVFASSNQMFRLFRYHPPK